MARGAPSKGSASRRPAEQGQAIIFILAMIPVIALSLLAVYNVAISTREKMKLQATADAATYSASVLVARKLNYLAYTNRAMAANEAGVAFVASLQTSTGMLASTAANALQKPVVDAGRLVALFPVLAPVLIPLVAPVQSASDAIGSSGPLFALPFQITVDLLRGLNYSISLSQATMVASTLAQLPETVSDVLEANDPDATLPPIATAALTTKFAADALTFIRPYTSSDFDEMMRFAHAAQATRDDFTRSRRILPGIRFADFSKDLAGLDESLSINVLNWRGGTELVAQSVAGIPVGQIGWHSGDNLDVRVPGRNTYTEYSEPPNAIPNDSINGRLGLGASAATPAGPVDPANWHGHRLAIPGFYNQDRRAYGGLAGIPTLPAINQQAPIVPAPAVPDGTMVLSDSFNRAANSVPALPLYHLPHTDPVMQFGSHLKYGPSTTIGLVTSGLPFAPFWDLRVHPPMWANEDEGWLEDLRLREKNPLNWGSRNANGPTFSLVIEKSGRQTRTAQMAGFGSTAREDGVGLKDFFGGGSLKAVSASQIYFQRPQDRWARRDNAGVGGDLPTLFGHTFGFTGGYVEHKSLFSPYWQVRNVQPSFWAVGVAAGLSIRDALADGPHE